MIIINYYYAYCWTLLILLKTSNSFLLKSPSSSLLKDRIVLNKLPILSIRRKEPAFFDDDEPSSSSDVAMILNDEDEEEKINEQKYKQQQQKEQQPYIEIVEDDPEEVIIARPENTRCVKGVAARTGPLNQEVARIANTTLQNANELIKIGAVWARMEALTEEDVLSQYYDFGLGAMATAAQYADLPKGWGSGEWDDDNDDSDGENEEGEGKEQDLDSYVQMMYNQRYRRIMEATVVGRGTDIRVYPSPRRFPSCYELTRKRLLYEDTTFIVVDKPPMLPTQPDSSNYLECCPGCVNDLMGPFKSLDGETVERPLLCHRVDSIVGGCVVMSKDPNGQKVFQQFQKERKIKKVYLAVTNNPVPLGMHIHWMWAPQAARGTTGGPPCQLLSHTTPASRRKARENWIRCVLEVVKCEPIDVPQKINGYTHLGKPHYQSTIRLVTGRKHQVRAQLSSLGCPIIRDTLYSPISGYTLDNIEDDEGSLDDGIMQCKIPTEPIGLQAHAILFGGIRAKAKSPWWKEKKNIL